VNLPRGRRPVWDPYLPPCTVAEISAWTEFFLKHSNPYILPYSIWQVKNTYWVQKVYLACLPSWLSGANCCAAMLMACIAIRPRRSGVQIQAQQLVSTCR